MSQRKEEVLADIGCCIYCGTRSGPLTKEHIVPFALDGVWVLDHASCASCAERTSKFERQVLRRAAGALRTGLGLPTRRPTERPTSFRFQVVRGGETSEVDVPISDYIPLFWFPLFPPPFALRGERHKGISVPATRSIQVANPTSRFKSLDELGRALGADNISQSLTYPPTAFAQLVAKAAYGMAIARLGVDAFEQVDVLPALLTGEDVGTWVGGVTQPEFPEVDPSCRHAVHVYRVGQTVRARVKLLADYGGPEYEVLIGRLREGTTPERN